MLEDMRHSIERLAEIDPVTENMLVQHMEELEKFK
jgi:hypothetical protein